MEDDQKLAMAKRYPIQSIDECGHVPAGVEHAPALLQNTEADSHTWALRSGIRLEYIQPGKPQQNAYVERFNRTVRYEWLSQYHWDTLEEVQQAATEWMWSYNNERPNMALGGITPKQRLTMAA